MLTLNSSQIYNLTLLHLEQAGQIANRSADDLRQELSELKAKLDLNLATNSGVVEQFEKRQDDVRIFYIKYQIRPLVEHR